MFSDTTKLYTDTTPIDKDYAAAAVKELYCYCATSSILPHHREKKTPSRSPEIIFVGGPNELKEKIADLYRRIGCGFLDKDKAEFFHAESFNDIAHFVTKRGWGPKERMHSVLAKIFDFEIPKFMNQELQRRWASPMMLAIDWLYHPGDESEEERGYIDPWEKVASKVWDNAYLIVTFLDRCYVVDRPLEVHVNDMGFHRTDGPAILFRDGSEIFCYEGLRVDRKFIMEPETLTLKDIHQHNSRKHYLIDLVGVDNYLEMVKQWEPPETKGKWDKFFSFSKMVLPTDDLPDEKDERGFTKFRERGYGYHSYKDKPYEVDIYLGKVNGEFGLTFSARDGHEVYHFPYKDHPFDCEHGKDIFNEEDRELFDLFDFKEMFNRSMAATFTLSYMNRKFRLKSSKLYEHYPSCRHDVAPAWFKAKMFRKEAVEYISPDEKFGVKWEPGLDEEGYERGNLYFGGDFPGEKDPRDSLFGGCDNLPSYSFDVDLEADSWEELLEKWARLAFEWLALHEDSSRMP
jgi:hypothetical protein